MQYHRQCALSNGTGILLDGADGNALGGENLGDGNIIAANRGVGIHLRNGANDNAMQGNYIGVNVAGDNLGNGGHGILIETAADRNKVNQSNLIGFSGGDGVRVDGAAANTISGNGIYQNAGLGIENLSGGNAELAPPQMAGASGTEASGAGRPGSLVEVFGDDGAQGRFFLGSTTADAFGNFVYRGILIGKHVTATATDAAGNTSEFAGLVEREVPCDDTFETNDIWTQSHPMAPDTSLNSFICESTDVDFFKLPVSSIPFGSKVTFTLSGMDVDLDLFLFRPPNVPWDIMGADIPLQNQTAEDIPVRSLPVKNTPLQMVPLQMVPLQMVPLQMVPLQMVPLQNTPLQMVPLQMVPLQMVPLQMVPVADYSLQSGSQAEEVSERAYTSRTPIMSWSPVTMAPSVPIPTP